MTFKTMVKAADGTPIEGLLVTANDENNGESFTRSTDGTGYADVAMLGSCHVGDRVSFVILDPQMRYKGVVLGDALMVSTEDQRITETLQPFKKASVLPAPPTRDQLCGVRCSFQGLTVATTKHGNIPWFEPALAWPDFAEDHVAVYATKHAAGDTHVNLAVSSQYDEPNQTYEGLQGRDFAYDLPALRTLITEAICAGAQLGLPNGFMVLLAMAGDGMGADPVGMTYGCSWLMTNFARIWHALKGSNGEADLTPWILPTPGYDGVVPAWQPWSLVNDYVRMAKAVVGPAAPLALWLSAGYCVWSGESNDWATEDGQSFDVILQEFPFPMGPPAVIPAHLLMANGDWAPAASAEDRAPWDQVWQIVGRMVQPYHRPPNQPANDDGGGAPFLLSGGTPRGPFVYVALEFSTYGHVRGYPLEDTLAQRAYLRSLGCTFVG